MHFTQNMLLTNSITKLQSLICQIQKSRISNDKVLSNAFDSLDSVADVLRENQIEPSDELLAQSVKCLEKLSNWLSLKDQKELTNSIINQLKEIRLSQNLK